MAYKAPFVDLPKHWSELRDELLPVIDDVLGRGQVIMRDELERFEQEIAHYCGSRFAVGLNSCTDGMLIALRAAGVGAGDEVITVAHTFVATVASIVHNSATPVLVDIRVEDQLMDMDAVAAAITPQTRAVIPVHLNGRICDMAALQELAERHDLVVIEDAAQALGASLNGRRAGSFGLAGSFSLYPMKLLGAYGDGGILVTDDEQVYRTARSLRDHGQDRSTGEVIAYGYNSRLDNLQAAILSVKLKHFPSWLEHRRMLASVYEEELQEVQEVTTPAPPSAGEDRYDVFQNYVIRTTRRDELVEHLGTNGVEVLVSWPVPMHHHPNLGLKSFDLPNTEEISRTVLSLPMNAEVTEEQARYTASCIRSFYA